MDQHRLAAIASSLSTIVSTLAEAVAAKVADMVADRVVKRLETNDLLSPSQAALPELLTTKQAAALLGLSVKGLEHMRAEGYGPKFERHGKRGIRYRRSELLKGS